MSNAWRIGDTADSLGISRKNLWEKMKRHSIAEPAKGSYTVLEDPRRLPARIASIYGRLAGATR